MAVLAIAIPILPDKTDAWRRMLAELSGPRKSEFDASRRGVGVRERTFLQHSPMGDLVIATLEGDDPAGAFPRLWNGTDAFTTWFREQVKEIHGVDLSAPPDDPIPELVLDSGA